MKLLELLLSVAILLLGRIFYSNKQLIGSKKMKVSNIMREKQINSFS